MASFKVRIVKKTIINSNGQARILSRKLSNKCNTQGEFNSTKENGQEKGKWNCPIRAKGYKIIFDPVGSAQRVDTLDKAGEDEYERYENPGDVGSISSS